LAQTIVVRKYEKGDEKDIFELWRVCYGEVSYDYFIKHWVWECEKNPLGKHIWIAECNGKMVAHLLYIPVDLKVGKEIFRSVIVTHAMTHPNFQGKGLQRRLQAVSREELVKEGIYVLFWWPREIFYRHRRKESDYLVCKIPVMEKFLDTDEFMEEVTRSRFLAKCISIWLNPILRVFFGSKKNPVNENLKIKEITRFDDRINDFWEDVSRNFSIIVVRKKEHLNWQYFQRPNSNFKVLLAEEDEKILGYIVFTSEDKKGFVADLLAYPHRPDVAQSLITIATKQLREENVHRIFCQMLKLNNPYYRILRANSFLQMSSSKYPFGVTVYSPSKVLREFLRSPRNWYLTANDLGARTTI
jgi:hypothetical protein